MGCIPDMNNGRAAASEPAEPDFVRVTLTLPRAVSELADRMAEDPKFAGNRSALVRTLILEAEAQLQEGK